MELIGIDDHLMASTLSGIIDKINGAANYLNDWPKSSQVTKILALHVISKIERLSIQNVVDPEYAKSQMKKATHLVVGVDYGVEAYCVLTRDLDDRFDDEDARGEVDDYLSDLANTFVNAIKDFQTFTEFQKNFTKEEKQGLTRMKCRLYADLQTQPVRECNVFDAYKHCMKLISEARESDSEKKNKAVPISVRLYSLKAIINETRDVDDNFLEYRDVEATLISRCYHISAELEKLRLKAETASQTNSQQSSTSTLVVDCRQFIDAIVKFQNLMKKDLKNGIVKARQSEDGDDEEVEKVVDIVENLSLFHPSRLEQWLMFKELEFELLTSKMFSLNGITFLANRNKLVNELADADKKYALVMLVPSPDDRTKQFLNAMIQYVDIYTRLLKMSDVSSSTTRERDEDLPWHMIDRKRKTIQDKIRKFSDYVAKNKHLENKVSFILTFSESSQVLGCQYSIYEGCKLFMENLDRFPVPPTNIRVRLATSGETTFIKTNAPVCVEWDYEFQGYPTQFLVEYRTKESYVETWKKQNTSRPGDTRLFLNFQPGIAMEIRVAADTCIGRSEFSEIVDTIEIIESSLEKDGSIQFADEPGPSKEVNESTIPKFQFPAQAKGKTTSETTVKSNNQQANGNQQFKATNDFKEKKPIEKDLCFPCTTITRWRIIGNKDELDVYAVPSTKTPGSMETIVERFSVGTEATSKMEHKTILLMGATGSGKTALINSMINYVFNVQWENPFRLQLIEEKGIDEAFSQTQKITAYDIHHSEGFRIPYSLTIIDTPGYGDTEGLDRDKEITEMVRKFFKDENGIQELDVVGFVAQAVLPRLTATQTYIFDSVLSIFGNDIKENIDFLLTFADTQVPPILAAISEADLPCPIDPESKQPLHHKFNNSGFYCSNRGSSNQLNQLFWDMGMENFDNFFRVLGAMNTKSLTLTKQVLEERKHLEATVDGLQPLIKIGLVKMEEMRKIKEMIANSQVQIEANESVLFEVEVTVPTKVEIPEGQYLTNCNRCYVTCHESCIYKNDDEKVNCAAMDKTMPKKNRSCTVCPNKCIWNMHANQPYKWEYVQEKQMTSSGDIKAKYETELNKILTAEDLIQVLQDALDNNEKNVLERVKTVTDCIRRLDEIALRPNPFSSPEYIDLIIEAEHQEKKLGFQERIKSLQRLREMAVLTHRIQTNPSGSLYDYDGNSEDKTASDT